MIYILKVAICDDDREYAANILRLAEEYREERSLDLAAAEFHSSGELISNLDDGARYDVYILDIYLDGESGLSIARRLREFDDTCAIFFLTWSKDHALEAFQVKAAHYLLKPIGKNAFFSALDRCRESLEQNTAERRFIAVKTRDGIEKIAHDDIVYIESVGKYQTIFTQNSEAQTKNTLQAVAEKLPDEQFFMPHRAFLVNIKQVKKISSDQITMKNGMEIPMSRRKQKDVKLLFLDYSFNSRQVDEHGRHNNI